MANEVYVSTQYVDVTIKIIVLNMPHQQPIKKINLSILKK